MTRHERETMAAGPFVSQPTMRIFVLADLREYSRRATSCYSPCKMVPWDFLRSHALLNTSYICKAGLCCDKEPVWGVDDPKRRRVIAMDDRQVAATLKGTASRRSADSRREACVCSHRPPGDTTTWVKPAWTAVGVVASLVSYTGASSSPSSDWAAGLQALCEVDERPI